MIIFDLEIKRAILGKNETPYPDVEYCSGWKAYQDMGISVICAYDYGEDRYRVFCEDNLPQFQFLVNRHNTIVGFNNISFDNSVCKANGLIVPENKSFDLLREIRKVAGLGPKFQFPSHMGYGLDAVIKATFPECGGKTGHGAMAPIHWQRGQIGNVIDYCMTDVWLTKLLMDSVLENRAIINPKTQKPLKIEFVAPGENIC